MPKMLEVVSTTDYLTEQKIKEVVEGHTCITHYIYVLHDKDFLEDGSPKKPHWHVYLKFTDNRQFEDVAKWFGISSNFLGYIKGRWVDALKYAIHKNAPEKHQYNLDECIANFNVEDDIKKDDSKKSKQARKEEIIKLITDGVIRPFNIHEHIDAVEYDVYKRSIENAFKFRNEMLKGVVDRMINVVYISGESQSGKSTYAKQLCLEKGYSVYISPGGKNLFDDYGGQDAVILDDLRAENMSVADILKLLDNNTASQVAARFYNKNINECKMIIITSTLTIDEFFKNLQSSYKEDIVQLKRRCKINFHMTAHKMAVRTWLEKSRTYSSWKEYPNPIEFVLKQKDMSEEEQMEFLEDFMTADLKALKQTKEEIKTSIPKYDLFD